MPKLSRTDLRKRGEEILLYLRRNNLDMDELTPSELSDVGAIGAGVYSSPILTAAEVELLCRELRKNQRSKKTYPLGRYSVRFTNLDGEVLSRKSLTFSHIEIAELGIVLVRGDITVRGEDYFRTRWKKKPTDEILGLLYLSLPEEYHKKLSNLRSYGY